MSERHKGHLKVYLGYAAGVGKTYRMLEEAQALQRQGVDIVVGYFEPHGRKETIAMTEGLEFVPRRVIQYNNAAFEEMDTDAILRRRPAVAIVDEFAHTNVPGSERLKRWEDVHALLDAGIDVIATMNVQHLESLNDQVWHVTGVRVRETLPDWVIAIPSAYSWPATLIIGESLRWAAEIRFALSGPCKAMVAPALFSSSHGTMLAGLDSGGA